MASFYVYGTNDRYASTKKETQFCTPSKFVVPRKICFKYTIKTKNIAPLKMYFAHQTLKPGYCHGAVQ